MYTLIGKAPASSIRPGMEVTLCTHTHMSEILRAQAFFSLHYDELEVITPKGVAK